MYKVKASNENIEEQKKMIMLMGKEEECYRRTMKYTYKKSHKGSQNDKW